MIGRTIDQLTVGEFAEISRAVKEKDILGFVDSVGDRDPIHSDRAFGATTPFGEPIAPGIWTAGLISAVMRTRLPGPGGIYVSQDLRFLRMTIAETSMGKKSSPERHGFFPRSIQFSASRNEPNR